jgi:hypothetical protein
MILTLALFKERMHDTAGLIATKLKAIKCPTGWRDLITSAGQCNTHTQAQAQTQIQTFPDRRIARSVNPKCYTLINSPESRVRKADYLGQAILKAQSKVVTEPYW